MRRTAWMLLLTAALGAPAVANDYLRTRPAPKEGYAYPEQFCVLRGERVELGEERCLKLPCRPAFTARCDMSGNNVTWRELREGCPEAVSAAPGAPAPAPRG